MGARRWVVKIGSALLTDDGRGLNTAGIERWVDQLVALRRSGIELVRRIAKEIVARPSLDKHPEIDKAEAYEILSRMATDPDEALDFLHQAQETAKAKGRSPARYLLAELPVHLQRGAAQESRRIIELLTSRHANEPGISEALFSLLSQMGLIRVDPSTGRPVMVVPSAGGPAMPGAEPAAAAAPASGLWTPEQAVPAAEGKGKLWLPGME